MSTSSRSSLRPRRWWIVAGVGLAALLLVGACIDDLAAGGVETAGSYAFGVPTHLANADIGLLSGNLELGGLRIDNPEGFQTPCFLSLERAFMDVWPASLMGDLVELPTLELSGLHLYLESRDGRSNHGIILGNLERLSSGGEDPDGTPAPEDGKRFVIREVVIRDVQVSAELLPLAGGATRANLTLPEVRLTDVGNADGGAPLSETVAQVVQGLLSAVVGAAGKLPHDIADELRQGLSREGLLEALDVPASVRLDKVGESVTETLSDLLGVKPPKDDDDDDG